MSKFLSSRLYGLKPYRLVTPESFLREQTGERVYKLDWNEGFFQYEGKISRNRYPCPDLSFYENEVLKIYNEKSYGLKLFPGSDVAHIEVLRTYADIGDKCLIFGPTYDNFRCTAESFGLKIEYVNSIKLDLDFLNNILSHSDCKLVYLCNPNNPTGEILELVDCLIEFHPNKLFLIDEAYIEFTEKRFVGKAKVHDNVIFFRTFSKAFSLAGVRLGAILGSKVILDDINLIYNPKIVSTVALDYIQIVSNNISKIVSYVNDVIKNRDYLQGRLMIDFTDKFQCNKSYGNFIFLNFEDKKSVLDLIERLESNNIFVRHFNNFHGISGIRITINDDIALVNSIYSIIEDLYK